MYARASASLRSRVRRLFRLQSPSILDQKCERFCLASLGQGVYFGFNIRSNSQQKCEGFCLASLGQAVYFGFNLRSNSKQKCESFCITSLGQCVYFGFNLLQFWTKNASASASPRSAKRSNWANGIEELLN